jgi:hypothetical protein
LEGADATRTVDEYSDIDYCCSVEPGQLAAIVTLAQAALETLGSLDLVHKLHDQDHFKHVTFHLAGTSDYLLVDFCAYALGRGAQFIAGDEIERPEILLDRGGVFQYSSPRQALERQNRPAYRQSLQDTVAQYARLDKYLKRGLFLESFGYYHKWLLMPLIEILRMRYSPLHPDYYIVHISRHLPPEVLARLEDLFKVNSTAEIEQKSQKAVQLFQETLKMLESAED